MRRIRGATYAARTAQLSSGSAAARGHRGGSDHMFVGRRGGKSTTPCSGCSRATLQPSSSMQPKFEYSVDTRQWCSSQRFRACYVQDKERRGYVGQYTYGHRFQPQEHAAHRDRASRTRQFSGVDARSSGWVIPEVHNTAEFAQHKLQVFVKALKVSRAK